MILTPNRYNNSNIIQFDFNNSVNQNAQMQSMDNSSRNNNEINKNMKRLIHSQTFDNIFRKETNWPKDLNDYQYKKKNLEWGKNPPANYVTKQYITSAERIFNPIIQKYNDKKYEEELKIQEKKDIINSIVKGYDKELKNIQVYNIINLDDRLKGLEDNQRYPKTTLQKRKKFFKLTPKINYNILSGYNFKIHHFDNPEKRPKIELNNKDNIIDFYNNGGKQRQKIILTRSLKDYNIISNEYNNYNKEKIDVDLKFQYLKAANNFYKKNNQNPLTGKYYDEEKEKKYQEQKELNIKNLLNKKKQGLYNPFNGIVTNEEELKKKEQLIENRILRFKNRKDLDNFYRMIDIQKEDKYMNMLKNKLFYQRFKEIDKRRFNILNNNEVLEINKFDKMKNKKTSWELIKEGSNQNESISKKHLNISKDKEEIEKQYIEAKIKRNEKIKNLPRINSDPFFAIKYNKSKINLSANNSKNMKKDNCFCIDKNEWFKKNDDLNINK